MSDTVWFFTLYSYQWDDLDDWIDLMDPTKQATKWEMGKDGDLCIIYQAIFQHITGLRPTSLESKIWWSSEWN
jgi:hypothetical protein